MAAPPLDYDARVFRTLEIAAGIALALLAASTAHADGVFGDGPPVEAAFRSYVGASAVAAVAAPRIGGALEGGVLVGRRYPFVHVHLGGGLARTDDGSTGYVAGRLGPELRLCSATYQTPCFFAGLDAGYERGPRDALFGGPRLGYEQGHRLRLHVAGELLFYRDEPTRPSFGVTVGAMVVFNGPGGRNF